MTDLDAHSKIEAALATLVEHYDSVLILCTVNQDGKTSATARRAGNFYASRGIAEEWLEDERNKELAFTISSSIKPDED